MNADITQRLEALASAQPCAPAFHAPGRETLTYADLGAQIRYVRERLQSWGIGRGNVVAGVIPQRPELAVACMALPAAASFAPLAPTLTTTVYRELFDRLRPTALVAPKHFDHPARALAQERGIAQIELVCDPHAPAGMFSLELRPNQRPRAPRGTAQPDWAYILATSGTSGRPKLVPYSHARVTGIAMHLWECLGLTADDVGCHLVPAHHNHGLTGALLTPLLRGAPVVVLPEADVEGFFGALEQYRLTWLTAIFSVHREILRCAREFSEALAANRLRCLRVSAGRLEPHEVDRIEQTFGAPLLKGYGMTEATPIAHDTLHSRQRKSGSVGQPVSDQVRVRSVGGEFCNAGQVGEIVVRGPLVFGGYVDDPCATAQAFVDGWFRTGDLGYIDPDGHLFLEGRIKDIINRGGEKISPAEVDAAIRTVPGVGAVATFGFPHPSLGEEVASAIVKESGATVESSDIVARVRQRMGAKRVPRHICFVDELPRTDSGKVRRSELPRLLGIDRAREQGTHGSAVKATTAMSPLEAALIGLWSALLRVDRVGVQDDFFLLGGDSLQGARLLASIKAVFGVEFTLEHLFEDCATVAGMAHAIEATRSRGLNKPGG